MRLAVAIAVISFASANPNGAPSFPAGGDINGLREHGPLLSIAANTDYTFETEAACYASGQELSIALVASSTAKPIKGFLVYVGDENRQIIAGGDLTPGDDSAQEKSADGGKAYLTHTDPTPKQRLSFTWKPGSGSSPRLWASVNVGGAVANHAAMLQLDECGGANATSSEAAVNTAATAAAVTGKNETETETGTIPVARPPPPPAPHAPDSSQQYYYPQGQQQQGRLPGQPLASQAQWPGYTQRGTGAQSTGLTSQYSHSQHAQQLPHSSASSYPRTSAPGNWDEASVRRWIASLPGQNKGSLASGARNSFANGFRRIPPGACGDFYEGCQGVQSLCANQDWAKQNCAKTCNLCSAAASSFAGAPAFPSSSSSSSPATFSFSRSRGPSPFPRARTSPSAFSFPSARSGRLAAPPALPSSVRGGFARPSFPLRTGGRVSSLSASGRRGGAASLAAAANWQRRPSLPATAALFARRGRLSSFGRSPSGASFPGRSELPRQSSGSVSSSAASLPRLSQIPPRFGDRRWGLNYGSRYQSNIKSLTNAWSRIGRYRTG